MDASIANKPKLPAIGWLCVLSPFFLLLTFITLALHVRLGLGHWPKPNFENYETPLFEIHELILLVIGIFAIYIAFPMFTLLLIPPSFRGPFRYHARQILIFIMGWLLIIAAANLDPTTFTDWFLD